MKEMIERAVDQIARKYPRTTEPRKVHDEISDYVAELLSRRAGQLERFGGRESRA